VDGLADEVVRLSQCLAVRLAVVVCAFQPSLQNVDLQRVRRRSFWFNITLSVGDEGRRHIYCKVVCIPRKFGYRAQIVLPPLDRPNLSCSDMFKVRVGTLVCLRSFFLLFYSIQMASIHELVPVNLI
jgi:hypothetical protein